jgi:hypothetical protein
MLAYSALFLYVLYTIESYRRELVFMPASSRGEWGAGSGCELPLTSYASETVSVGMPVALGLT